MATINQILERVSRLRPVQAAEDADLARWLLELEGRLWDELAGESALPRPPEPPEPQPEGTGEEGTVPSTPLTPAWPPAAPARAWPADGDMPLLAPAPYDRLYDLWLTAQLEFALQEYAGYNNTISLFNEASQAFAAWFRRRFPGKPRHGFVHVFS
ncbi:MAG TPA: hypothetical protein H9826_04970 [Candidatus Intestinimonas merdavium]|uniref:Uncharacterized protein n=1 Tax=Candidatus Intestinimonas merdavium TaxID=2838622 RepID=A0A9D1Z452_9FIRM|nr:hypothetical protein [Candidatus Intestinimonas merdavium]